MDVHAKYILYEMFYAHIMKLWIYRGSNKFIGPWTFHKEAMRLTNYCLAALDQEITIDEIIIEQMAIMNESHEQ